MEILYPDYDNCIANLACSVTERFGDGLLPVPGKRRQTVLSYII